jgi:16S rRNA processing protein RimM
MLEYLSIGQIVNTHGVRGEIKVYPLTNDLDRFRKLKQVLIEKNNQLINYNITSVKFLKNVAILKLENVDSVEEAIKLKNLYMKVDRSKAVKLPKGSYFICDLLDCQVYDNTIGLLGKLVNIIETGSNAVYVVKADNGKEILIPALKSVIKEINLEERKITTELPEGLI